MTAPLLSLAEYQALAAGTGLEQARLDGVIGDIRDYCGWHIAPTATETITLDGSGAAVVQVPTLRLSAVASVAENGVVIPATEYEWSEDGTLRRLPLGRCWTNRYRSVVVECTHGYAEVPAPIVSVVLDATSSALSGPVGSGGELPETMGPFTFGGTKGAGAFTAAQLRVLDRYKVNPRP
ncbi:Uncharacterised protein [Nocardia otitidiscaviarum]|uniref:Head-to-tail adaptor n=1 Tax=Nocardia otitidiscaviarum TaxID=1823 RepID=A0A378Y627_9NOCA|nr:hypothetical protein [Nocardia otitidiscaviarum]SUA72662.1 Uncharacterised protein [Nocardia otitidiscaviarum]